MCFDKDLNPASMVQLNVLVSSFCRPTQSTNLLKTGWDLSCPEWCGCGSGLETRVEAKKPHPSWRRPM